jgi:hypothetical protein
MNEKPIRHVSDTAHWIAHYRAIVKQMTGYALLSR